MTLDVGGRPIRSSDHSQTCAELLHGEGYAGKIRVAVSEF
jgi:hypothetical protein